MISPFTQTDLSAARQYFKAHLAVGDYYSQKHAGNRPVVWRGSRPPKPRGKT